MYGSFPHALQYNTDMESDCELIVELRALPSSFYIRVELHEGTRQKCLRHDVVHEPFVYILQFEGNG